MQSLPVQEQSMIFSDPAKRKIPGTACVPGIFLKVSFLLSQNIVLSISESSFLLSQNHRSYYFKIVIPINLAALLFHRSKKSIHVPLPHQKPQIRLNYHLQSISVHLHRLTAAQTSSILGIARFPGTFLPPSMNSNPFSSRSFFRISIQSVRLFFPSNTFLCR